MTTHFDTWPVPTLGVQVRDGGADVAVYSPRAEQVWFCALQVDEAGIVTDEVRTELRKGMYGIWHAFIPGIEPGQRYGFRAAGEWNPAQGVFHNEHKLLMDPYARAITGTYRNEPAVYGHRVDEAGHTLSHELDTSDSRDLVPHAVVIGPQPTYERPPKPHVAWEDTVIYEAHVRGLTKTLPGVPEHLRGTYAGLAHPATIAHLQNLGVTAIELLPIHTFLDEPHLRRKGLSNYWGYNTLGFFAPHEAYATEAARAGGPQAVIDEVRGMVDLLHEAGLEVILDVVYNHTCEGGADGPLLSWRGLANTNYYLHDGAAPARYVDVTGCGNALDFRRRAAMDMTLASLRWWTDVIGVDGYRFDLAVTLGRGTYGFDPSHPLFLAMTTDPIIRTAKLIAEPWDVGPGGWQTGRFPLPFAEWNDRFRNAIRTYWLTDPADATHNRVGHGLRELATRLAGSADMFGMSDPAFLRGTVASVNYVTAHDGFTLADLVTYSHKHNMANGENNADGSNDNRSWNHGTEGPVLDPEVGGEIVPQRLQSMRNLMATLLVSAGTPMLTAGDEIGRTQEGNNNAYAQDNEISWLDWNISLWQRQLLETTSFLLQLRRDHPTLRSPRFFSGRAGPDGMPDLRWHGSHGRELVHEEWNNPASRHLQMLRTWNGDSTLVVFNGALDAAEFTLAPQPYGKTWALAWDSAWPSPSQSSNGDPDEGPVRLAGLSMRIYVAK